MQTTIQLDHLKFGHEAVPPINARKLGRESDLEPLKASIIAHGLGQALNVREIDGTPYVADGNRRLAALRALAAEGALAADAPIKCDTDSTGDADELSLALNIQRLPMHEADQYEKFHEMRTRGRTEEQIASSFGIAPARVRKMVALGQLHPVILDAWRNNEFNDPIKVVQAFTMAPSQKAQKEIYDQLAKKGHIHPNRIREAFGAGNSEARKLLVFVGKEAYVAAGGKITEDLFGDDHAISDYDLLTKLVDDRIERECRQLEKSGWAWAEVAASLPQSWNYSWERIRPKLVDPTPEEAAEIKKLERLVGKKGHWEQNEDQRAAAARVTEIRSVIEARSFKPKDKKAAGVAVSIAQDGRLNVTYGVKKPVPKKPEKAKAGEAPAPAMLSNAVMQRLSVQVSKATKDALKADPKVALAAVLAGLAMGGGYGWPIMVKAKGLLKDGNQREPFMDVFQRFMAMPLDDMLVAVAYEAGQMVHIHTHRADQPPLGNPIYSQFVEAMPTEAMQDALHERFDAADYFQAAPKTFALAAITEALGEDPAKTAGKLKKGECVAFCLKNVPQTGWLPPELRTSTYKAPSPATSATPAASPKTKAEKKAA